MKIYTKKGDAGETGLAGGVRVSKDDLRIQTYGTLDELNCTLGVVLTSGVSKFQAEQLSRIQNELFQLGAELATPKGKPLFIEALGESQITLLEREIDEMEKSLTPLQNFILPGGSPGSAQLHIARTVCRRAERELVTLHRMEAQRPEVLQYLNRLADYFFVAARFANYEAKVVDVPWAPSKET